MMNSTTELAVSEMIPELVQEFQVGILAIPQRIKIFTTHCKISCKVKIYNISDNILILSYKDKSCPYFCSARRVLKETMLSLVQKMIYQGELFFALSYHVQLVPYYRLEEETIVHFRVD